MIALQAIIFAVAVYLGFYVLYNLVLLFAHFVIKPSPAGPGGSRTKFLVLIPANNEELLIGNLIRSATGQRYPAEAFRVLVVADNCTDKTARVATEFGARVLERTDPERGGKGYAIKWGIENAGLFGFDAVFIIDADSIMDPDVLKNLDIDITGGKSIIQCYNGVGNPDKSWFTRLLNVSRTLCNEIFHPAKEKLGLSSYLMGNGMCFTTAVLKKYGWHAFSVGEDWEYYAKLVVEGEVIGFSKEAKVYHQESTSLKQATTQRMRWSSGRFAVACRYGLPILFKGLARMDLKMMDASFPLLLPNPSLGANITVLFLAASLIASQALRAPFGLWFAGLLAFQLLIFLVGVAYTKDPLKNILSMFVAPVFLGWKLCIDVLSALGMGRKKWVRTERKL